MRERDWENIPWWVKFKDFNSCSIDDTVVFVSSFKPYKTMIGRRVKIDSGAVIYGGVNIGHDTIIGHGTIIRPNVDIGVHNLITNYCVLAGNLKIGTHCRLNHFTHIAQKSVLEDYVFVAQGFLSANDGKMFFFRKEDKGLGNNLDQVKGITLKRGCRIGIGARVLEGKVIGRHALVAAGAVVTRNVPAFTKVRGIPARIYGDVDPEEDKIIRCKFDHRR